MGLLKKKKARNKVFYFPFNNNNNKYNELQKEAIVKLGFDVDDIEKKSFRILIDRSYFVANWLESFPVNSNGKLNIVNTVKVFVVIALIVLGRSKLIWVKHNHKPHGALRLAYLVSKCVAAIEERIAIRVVVHSKDAVASSKYIYAPHPMYREYLPSEVDFNPHPKYLIMGRVMRYKGILELLNEWEVGVPLSICGQLEDNMLGEQISKIIAERKLTVDCTFKFISESEMWVKLYNADVVVLPHQKDTAIVSGNFYLAKSAGCIILSRFEESPSLGKGEFSFNNDGDLKEVLKKIAGYLPNTSRKEIFDEAVMNYGKDSNVISWQRIFE